MKRYLILIYFVVIIIVIYYLYENNIFNFKSNLNVDSLNQSAGNLMNSASQQVSSIINGQQICGVDISAIASQYNVPSSINFYNLVKAVIYQESSGIANLTNPSSSVNLLTSYGLMQVTEPVITSFGFTVAQASSSGTNIYIGASYLGQLLEQNSYDIASALSQYNSGQNWDVSYADSVIAKYNSLNSSGIAYDNNGNAYGSIQCS